MSSFFSSVGNAVHQWAETLSPFENPFREHEDSDGMLAAMASGLHGFLFGFVFGSISSSFLCDCRPLTVGRGSLLCGLRLRQQLLQRQQENLLLLRDHSKLIQKLREARAAAAAAAAVTAAAAQQQAQPAGAAASEDAATSAARYPATAAAADPVSEEAATASAATDTAAAAPHTRTAAEAPAAVRRARAVTSGEEHLRSRFLPAFDRKAAPCSQEATEPSPIEASSSSHKASSFQYAAAPVEQVQQQEVLRQQQGPHMQQHRQRQCLQAQEWPAAVDQRQQRPAAYEAGQRQQQEEEREKEQQNTVLAWLAAEEETQRQRALELQQQDMLLRHWGRAEARSREMRLLHLVRSVAAAAAEATWPRKQPQQQQQTESTSHNNIPTAAAVAPGATLGCAVTQKQHQKLEGKQTPEGLGKKNRKDGAIHQLREQNQQQQQQEGQQQQQRQHQKQHQQYGIYSRRQLLLRQLQVAVQRRLFVPLRVGGRLGLVVGGYYAVESAFCSSMESRGPTPYTRLMNWTVSALYLNAALGFPLSLRWHPAGAAVPAGEGVLSSCRDAYSSRRGSSTSPFTGSSGKLDWGISAFSRTSKYLALWRRRLSSLAAQNQHFCMLFTARAFIDLMLYTAQLRLS